MYFYVIMPVGADREFEDKRSILQKLADKEGVTPYFPFDRMSKVTFDMETTLSKIRKSHFVLADLSMERPSCYFELGLAQAVGKDVYLIAQQNTDIHQAHGRGLTRFYEGLSDYEQIVLSVLKDVRETKPLELLRA
jgi:nucleoside 2-deoxyribosyltransferase